MHVLVSLPGPASHSSLMTTKANIFAEPVFAICDSFLKIVFAAIMDIIWWTKIIFGTNKIVPASKRVIFAA